MIKLIIFLRPNARSIFIAWLLTIITVSSIPSIPTLKIRVADSVFRLDYLMHICEYGFLAFMTFLTFSDKDFQIQYRKLFVLTAGLILFAVLDEFHQKFIPGRSFNTSDILSNVTGILFTLAFTLFIFRRIRAKIRNTEEIL